MQTMTKSNVSTCRKIGIGLAGIVLLLAAIGFRKTVIVASATTVGVLGYNILTNDNIQSEQVS